jgi:hypothetical protein
MIYNFMRFPLTDSFNSHTPMTKHLPLSLFVAAAFLAGCTKKPHDNPPAASVPPAAAAPSSGSTSQPQVVAVAVQSDQDRELARKKELLDYGTMENNYISDARAQWAASAKASSVFGDDNGKKPSEGSMPANVIGPVDGKTWTNNHQDIGFDTLEVGFGKPVNATEVRVVFPGGEGVEAVSKVELQDTDGKWNEIWSGVSEVKRDQRGSRTWFVRTFPKTAYKANAMRMTIANNVQRGYKEVDAVQIVGE